jgi:hypothetical protein
VSLPAEYRHCPAPLGTLLAGELDDETTALDAVDEDEARFEPGVAGPGADELDLAAAVGAVVLGMDVNEGGLADGGAGGVLGDGRDIVDAQTGTVVALVDVAVDDVLVVVDA